MNSPPWEPPRPPSGPPPGWHRPNDHGPYGGQRYPPPGGQWPPGPPPPSGPGGQRPPAPTSPFGSQPPYPYGGFGPCPPRRTKTSTWWLLGIAVVLAVALVGAGLLYALGIGPRDESSYQAGRAAAENGGGSVLVEFGGADPQEWCKGQFTLATPIGERSDYRRGDFIDGCLDALADELNR